MRGLLLALQPKSVRRSFSYRTLVCKSYDRGLQLAARGPKLAPRRPNNWPAEQRQNAEEICYLFFKIHFSVLTIYIFISIINEILILVKFSSTVQDTVQLL